MKITTIIFLSLILFYSCTPDNNKNNDIENPDRLDSVHISLLGKLDYMIKRFPLPSEIITSLFNTRALYNPDDMNLISNQSRYNTNYYKAINLGIYATDLIYAIRYEQTQTSLDYLNVVKKMSEEIGVTNVYDEKILSRFQNNIDEKDSLLQLSHMAFSDLKRILRNNEQIEITVLVLAGTWFEGLHLSTSNFTESRIDDLTNELIINIHEHKNQVKVIIDILQDIKENNVYLNNLYEDLKNIDSFMNNLHRDDTINKAEIEQLSKIVKDIRLKYIL